MRKLVGKWNMEIRLSVSIITSEMICPAGYCRFFLVLIILSPRLRSLNKLDITVENN